ncbi:hypothetical protein [Novosphingobium sp. TH158]|uniref:hypothetical protein n=1 Tax=Novosphingobium sp. TH158 TaxID=2067455 RepID=UPI0011818736|nr:hypothetical protein [Novosphingobium sp. TH158]
MVVEEVQARQAAAAFDRYAHWRKGPARLALAVLLLLAALAAWAPGMPRELADAPDLASTAPPTAAATPEQATAADGEKDNDLRLYRLIADRVAKGEDYYAAATRLQRENGYPVAPGLTVRLPTLAYLTAWLGQGGLVALNYALVLAVLFFTFRRFAEEPGGEPVKLVGTALLLVGLATGLSAQFLVLHEIWAAELMVLSFALHRPDRGKWIAAWFAAAAALAVRELALPFGLLMAAMALWRGNRREGLAWLALVAIFAAALAMHLSFAQAQIRAGDPVSPSWLALEGIGGWLYKVEHSSVLNLLPQVIAGPLAVLAVFGWTGWKGHAGTFAALLSIGYAVAFMIAGRQNNFYWGVIAVPFLFMGLAWMPFALRSLIAAAMRSGVGTAT